MEKAIPLCPYVPIPGVCVVNLPHASILDDYLDARHSKYVFYSHKQAKDEMPSVPFGDPRDGHWSPTHQHWVRTTRRNVLSTREDSPSFLPRIDIPGRVQTFPVLRENQLYLIVHWILLEGGTYRHEHWLVYRKICVRTTATGLDQL